MLRYFITMQDSSEDLVYIVEEEEKYKILNDDREVIENEFDENTLREIEEEEGFLEEYYMDVLVSKLIGIAPKRIKLEIDNQNIKNHIENIFEMRVI